MAKLFADLYKPLDDFFSKDYERDQKLSVKVKSDEGTLTEGNLTISPKSAGEIAVEQPLTISGKTLKTRFNFAINGNVNVKATADGSFVKGLKNEFGVVVPYKSDKGEFCDTLEFKNEYKSGNLGFSAALKKAKDITLTPTLTYALTPTLYFGGTATIDVNTSKPKSWNASSALFLKGGNVIAATFASDNAFKFGWLAAMSTRKLKTAVEFNTNLVKPDPSLQVGFEKALCANTIKAKLNSKGVLGLSLKAPICKGSGFTGIVGGSANIPQGTHALGFKVEYDG